MGRQKGEGEGEVRSSSRSSRGVPPEEARCARREGEEAEEAKGVTNELSFLHNNVESFGQYHRR